MAFRVDDIENSQCSSCKDSQDTQLLSSSYSEFPDCCCRQNKDCKVGESIEEGRHYLEHSLINASVRMKCLIPRIPDSLPWNALKYFCEKTCGVEKNICPEIDVYCNEKGT